MPLASSLTPDSRFVALFVGPKQSGKTSAACSWISPAPSKKRLKALDVDGRLRGILGCSWIDRSRIDYDYFPPRIADNDKPFYERVEADLDALLVMIKANQSPYETFLLDSATFYARNLVLDAIPFTHAQNKGNKIGSLEIAGPQDYNFEVTGMGNVLAYLKALPLNIIVTAHIEDKWDKPRDDQGNRMQYADNIVVGERISLRPKVDNVLSGAFDHIVRFDRKIVSGQERFYVEYVSDVGRISFPGFKPGRHDITGKNFREYTMNLVTEYEKSQQIPAPVGPGPGK